MTTVSKNIKILRKSARLTQEQLAEKIGIKRSLLGAYEEGRADPRLNNLLAIARIFKVSVDQLISSDVSNPEEMRGFSNARADGATALKILSITVDNSNNENIELVPYKASAGYLNGYADPEYIGELPRFQLPFLPSSGTYRAFEITGDSMLPLTSGTIVIGQYVERLDEIKNGETYILLSQKEGVVYKRLIYQKENNSLFLISDNKNYPPYSIDAAEVLEIWEAKTYISRSFPKGSSMAPEAGTGILHDGHEITLESLAGIVLNLQKEVINLQSASIKNSLP